MLRPYIFIPWLMVRLRLMQPVGRSEQRLDCTAWIATLPAGSLALAERSILVCAPSESVARACLEGVVTAMQARPAGASGVHSAVG
ncbi:MAG TPA: hypothetical protein VEU73_03625 [Gemmatimonadales bacterium]|nr:hypothetical protein [Gemmatimonadales bacterium]